MDRTVRRSMFTFGVRRAAPFSSQLLILPPILLSLLLGLLILMFMLMLLRLVYVDSPRTAPNCVP
jgi:hypothetical protein